MARARVVGLLGRDQAEQDRRAQMLLRHSLEERFPHISEEDRR